MVNKVDTELTKNTRFMDRVHLLSACYLIRIDCLVLIENESRKLEEVRSHALRLAVRFLGESHYLTVKIGALRQPHPIKIRNTPNITSSEQSFASKLSPTDTTNSSLDHLSPK
jgi:hypothetical protein